MLTYKYIIHYHKICRLGGIRAASEWGYLDAANEKEAQRLADRIKPQDRYYLPGSIEAEVSLAIPPHNLHHFIKTI